MFCSKCGEILRDGTRKCPVCGATLDKRTSAVNSVRKPSRKPRDAYDHTHYECQEKDCSQVNFTCRHAFAAASVSFPQAVRMFFERVKDFSGRSCRSEFWWAQLMLAAGYLLASFMGLGFLWFIVTVFPAISLGVRRLHDVGIPGFIMLVLLIPFVGGILFLVLASRPSGPTNLWGEPRT